MKNAEKIDKLIKNKLKTKASPQLDWRIDDLIMQAEKTQTQTSHRWRIIMTSTMTKLAVAAVLIIAVLIGVNRFGGSIEGASVAFAAVKEAVNKMPLMHTKVDWYQHNDGYQHNTERWYRFDSKSVLSKYSTNGECYKISSLNYNTMENVVYDPGSDIVKVRYRVDVGTEYLHASPWVVVEDDIKDYERRGASITREKKRFEGEDVDVYYLTIPSDRRKKRIEAEFFVNRSNDLPILYKRKTWTRDGQLISDGVARYDFPESGPTDIYDLGVSRTTEVVHDLESKKRLARKKELLEEKAVYEKQFKEIYRLEEGEVLKYIPPSLVKPRMKIDEIRNSLQILEREGSPIMQPYSSDEIKRMNENKPYTKLFRWNGETGIARGGSAFRDGVTLKYALRRIIVLSQFQYDDIPDTLSNIKIKIPGDLVVRNGAPKEQLLKAFEEILQDYTNRPIHFEKRQVERDVIAVRGKFQFKPLTGTYDDNRNRIYVFSDKMDPDERGGGGSYSLDGFLIQRLGETQLKQHVVNLTESSDNVRFSWHCQLSAYLGKIEPGAERDDKFEQLLDNLSRQTSLVFTRERRKVDIWSIVDCGK